MSTAEIARHASRPISPRRQAGLILEATFAAVSLVLLAWLLLWFIHQYEGRPRLDALFVRGDHLGVLFQERDARSLVGDRPDLEKKSANLAGALAEIVQHSEG